MGGVTGGNRVPPLSCFPRVDPGAAEHVLPVQRIQRDGVRLVRRQPPGLRRGRRTNQRRGIPHRSRVCRMVREWRWHWAWFLGVEVSLLSPCALRSGAVLLVLRGFGIEENGGEKANMFEHVKRGKGLVKARVAAENIAKAFSLEEIKN